MTGEILGQTSFTEAAPGWQLEPEDTCGLEIISDGAILSAPDGEVVEVRGRGVHTRNGASIELRFASASDLGSGWLRFGFDADMPATGASSNQSPRFMYRHCPRSKRIRS